MRMSRSVMSMRRVPRFGAPGRLRGASRSIASSGSATTSCWRCRRRCLRCSQSTRYGRRDQARPRVGAGWSEGQHWEMTLASSATPSSRSSTVPKVVLFMDSSSSSGSPTKKYSSKAASAAPLLDTFSGRACSGARLEAQTSAVRPLQRRRARTLASPSPDSSSTSGSPRSGSRMCTKRQPARQGCRPSPRPRGVTLAVPAGVRRMPTPGRVEAFGTAVGGFVLVGDVRPEAAVGFEAIRSGGRKEPVLPWLWFAARRIGDWLRGAGLGMACCRLRSEGVRLGGLSMATACRNFTSSPRTPRFQWSCFTKSFSEFRAVESSHVPLPSSL
mmetsp:Transcript_12117/g.36003  ORF Transcript_12117/g.36003 Transcript_12117/m.36003 type:complete len:329 (-) Transcript_12117:119-1105(-)